MDRSVIVIGGGIAGLAAACALADEGFAVTVLEKRGLLGGRASSYIDTDTGEHVDNCQHVTMRCCTNLEDFYRRIGVADKIKYFDTLQFLDPLGRVSRIRRCSGFPAPLHTLPSFLTFGALGLRDKIGIGSALLSILRSPEPPDTDMESWLRRRRQTPRAIGRFWLPILVSACNEDLDRISCVSAFKVFRDGFLAHPAAYEMGLPTVSLGELYTEPAIAYLSARGGIVRCKETVDSIEIAEGRVGCVKLVDGSMITADHYVSAVPFDLLLKFLPVDVVASSSYFAGLSNLEFSPIIGVHLWFDRKLDVPEAVALLDREMQWIFNKSAIRNSQLSIPNSQLDSGTYLSLVVSSAKRLADMPREQILEIALKEVYECMPAAADARLIKSQVIKERKATFSPLPGAEKWRPDQRSPIPNLFLAGDWTRTGWPATMEGAVRSGYRAAEYIFGVEEIKRRAIVPELPPSGLSQLLIRRKPA